jgi:hypothetical protein
MADKIQTENNRRKDASNKKLSSDQQRRGASSGNEKHKADFDKGGSTSKGAKRGEAESPNKGRNSI